jgi:hypothetical protein
MAGFLFAVVPAKAGTQCRSSMFVMRDRATDRPHSHDGYNSVIPARADNFVIPAWPQFRHSGVATISSFPRGDNFVIPAKAGIHFDLNSTWIPAFAGMTFQDG